MQDILKDVQTEVLIGDHGIVALVDAMPRLVATGQTLDHAVLSAARVSYGEHEASKTEAENRGLIRYLLSHRHTTPFEMVVVKWYHKLPIFVARQLIRHRMVSVNEYSMRYKEPTDEFFCPDIDEVRKQAKNNKQGSEGQVDADISVAFRDVTEITAQNAMTNYKFATAAGIGRELARINLPLTTFTQWYWKIDLHNLMHFLSLRMDSHAQKEIRDYADAMYKILQPLAPLTFEAFEDFNPNRGAMTLSALEIEAMRTMVNGQQVPVLSARATKREQDTWQQKAARIIGRA